MMTATGELSTDQRVALLEVKVNRLEDALAQFLAGQGGAKPETTPIYSQRDPRWSNIKLGTGATSIGQEGCLMTDAAQMLTELGHVMTPADLNAWLLTHGGYVAGNHFVYASIDALGVTKFKTLGACVSTPAPVGMLDQVLAKGGYAICEVDFSPSPGIQQHWVIYRGNGFVTDPWYGDKSSITRYGKDAATAIIGYAIYDRLKP